MRISWSMIRRLRRTSNGSAGNSRRSTISSPRSTRSTALAIGLRSKVVLVALVLAVIPFVGWLHVQQMEALLRQNQEQALLAAARAVATALSSRENPLGLRPAEMELTLKILARAESRIWIVDQRHRLIALAGSLKSGEDAAEPAPPPAPIDYAMRLIRPVTNRMLERPT